MRKLLTALVVAATTVLLPAFALADNQEVADEIARRLRDSGQLSNYKVAVKYQDGTAWLRGEVQDRQQLNVALKTVFATAGVTRVVNGLTMRSSAAGKTAATHNTQSNTKKHATIVETASPAKQTEAPTQTSIAQRLESVLGAGSKSQKQVASMPATGRAHRIADSINATSVQKVSATMVSGSSKSSPASAQTASSPTATQTAVVNPVRVAVNQAGIPMARAVPMGASNRPIPVAYIQSAGGTPQAMVPGGPIPAYVAGTGGGVAPARYDQPHLPNYSWPSYSAYPNYAALTYPRQYSPTAWPFIGPFYPYPQVPLGWRKVTLEWDDGWWMLDFDDSPSAFSCVGR